MLLPHGYDGQGPEHSSCRPERYLQLCDQDDVVPNGGDYKNLDELKNTNMQVLNCSTAANYFHALRFHQRMSFRKPLIVVAPKKLLKFKGASSNIEEFAEGTKFNVIYKDNHDLVAKDKVRKVVLCSGQVSYDLEAKREKEGINDVAIIRVEQLCPFPFKEIIAQLGEYKNATITWAQEEPKNGGYWEYAQPRLWNILEHLNRDHDDLSYAGRPISASTATGFTYQHNKELQNLLSDAFA
mmetsp:Transcript_28150/g.42588  ORF Transcript_28150/g.42588 Transcript_28150/m.42588 type:complete len:240 (+) Transcript_28150:2426-3145(+)